MSDLISTLAPYAIGIVVAFVLGNFLRRRAPNARWIHLGVLIATVAVAQTSRDLILRGLGVCIGVGLVVWDYRRNRTSANKTS